MTNPTAQNGITLVEVLIGISIVSVSLVAIGFSVTSYVEARTVLLQNMKATYLAEEGYEVLRAIRDNDWNTIEALSIDTTHYLEVSTTTIAVSNTPEVIDTDFRRSFIIRDVYRNGSDDVVSSTTAGATIDDGAREVTIYVAGPPGTTTMQAILANLHVL